MVIDSRIDSLAPRRGRLNRDRDQARDLRALLGMRDGPHPFGCGAFAFRASLTNGLGGINVDGLGAVLRGARGRDLSNWIAFHHWRCLPGEPAAGNLCAPRLWEGP